MKKNSADNQVPAGVRFQHFHDSATNRLCLTIATQLLPNGNVKVAGVVVDPKQYNTKAAPTREMGKQIALGRLVCKRPSAEAKTVELSIEKLRELVTSRDIISLFPNRSHYLLRPRSEYRERREKSASKVA